MTSDIKLLKIDTHIATLMAKGETKNHRLINKWKRKRKAYLASIEANK